MFEVLVCTSVGNYCSNCFCRPEISKELREISAVKVNDLAAIVESKSGRNHQRCVEYYFWRFTEKLVVTGDSILKEKEQYLFMEKRKEWGVG